MMVGEECQENNEGEISMETRDLHDNMIQASIKIYKLRDLLEEKSPIRENNIDFAKDENSKHFSTYYYMKKLI